MLFRSKNLNFMKQFVDDVLDHKFMIDINDPNFKLITGQDWPISQPTPFVNFTNFGSYNWIGLTDGEKLHINSFVLVDFVPTSENICKYLFEYAQSRIGSIATVTAVELWETAKSHCRYTG